MFSSAFKRIKFSFTSFWILIWLKFYHNLPKIPLIAYHLIQKGKFYLLDQKIKSLYPFLITRDRILEKVSRITSKLWTIKDFWWHQGWRPRKSSLIYCSSEREIPRNKNIKILIVLQIKISLAIFQIKKITCLKI